MRKQGLFALAFMLMLPFTAFAADSTTAPPGVTMAPATGMVPEPPVCNTNTQKLHWNGSGWQCIGVGHANTASSASSVTGYARGSYYGFASHTSNCPSGTSYRFSTSGLMGQNQHHCFKD